MLLSFYKKVWMSGRLKREGVTAGGRMRLKMVLYLLLAAAQSDCRGLGLYVSCRTQWPSPASERRIGDPLAAPWKKFAVMD